MIATIAKGVPVALLQRAEQAARSAYAPYSDCHVGTALMLADGSVHMGCNVENGVFGLGLCAERAAIAAAVVANAARLPIVEVVIVALDQNGRYRPAPPCGACRQVLAELAATASIWFVDTDGQWQLRSVNELLPDAFSI